MKNYLFLFSFLALFYFQTLQMRKRKKNYLLKLVAIFGRKAFLTQGKQ